MPVFPYMTCQLRIVMTATTPFPLFHILGSHHMPQRFYVLLLKKVRLLGRLYLWRLWGLGLSGDYTTIFYYYLQIS